MLRERAEVLHSQGIDTPDAGTVTVGETVKLMYVDQNRDSLDDGNTVGEWCKSISNVRRLTSSCI